MTDTLYTNGVIAVKEKQLLGEKLFRLAELSAGDAFRALSEQGFGGGAAADPAQFEQMCLAEESALDEFIREYAPDRAHAAYFLLPRDYHNMKALFKAKLLFSDDSSMLAPEGLSSIEELRERMENDPSFPGKGLENATGAEIGAAFDRALYLKLFELCKRHGTLKKLLTAKVDRINLLTAMRCEDFHTFESLFLPGGKLKKEPAWAVREGKEKPEGEMGEFAKALLSAREKGIPYAQAERDLDSFETEFFFAGRYDLGGKEPFLYYVFRRRAEIANVRILLVMLNAGAEEREIRKRLRKV